jgi:WD40 repeat protein
VAVEHFKGRNDWVCSVAFSSNGKHIASGSADKMVRVWDAEREKAVRNPLEGHGDTTSRVRFSMDGTRVVSGSYDKTVRVWNVETGKAVGGPFEWHSGPA